MGTEERKRAADTHAPPVSLEPNGLEQFLRFAAERFSEALYWIDEDANILHVNNHACWLTGYSRQELTAMKVYELNVDLDAGAWPAIWELLRTAGQRTFEVRHRHRDGSVVPCQVSAAMFPFGGHDYSCAFLRDLSERKQLEDRLRQAEKMEAIGRLAGGVAHDFNNQLAGIMGYAELLRREVTHNVKAEELAEQLAAAVKVAADLTAQLLAVSRRGKFLAQVIDLHSLVGDVINMFVRTIDRQVFVHPDLNATQPWTEGDPSQLQSAVLNLLLNARDAMPRGGKITVSSSNRELSGNEAASVGLTPGRYITLSVKDTGVGIEGETLERIFEPFFTTKESGSGTGLGLAAVYGTAKNHQGAIGVTSNLGEGSTFTLYLPESARKGARRERADEIPCARLRGRVVVIDDDQVVRDTEAKMLTALGCQVTSFADAESALTFFENFHGEVDLVVLDLIMPGMSGKEAFRWLQEVDPHVKVVMASGYSLDDQAQRLLEAGARGFLQKPFTMTTLANTLGPLLAGA